MQLSDWAQEDPATTDGIADEQYPNTTSVSFTSLRVDNHVPVLNYGDATALASPNRVVLVPSVVRNDGFDLEQGTATQGQYLRDSDVIDSAINRFVYPGITNGGTTAANGRTLITAIAAFDSQLSSQQWPPGSVADIQKLVVHDKVLSNDLRSWETTGESKMWLARYQADARLDKQYSNPVRSDLGLPPVGLDRT